MSNIQDTYRTLAGNSESHYRDKGSKFLAFAYSIDNEAEVKTILSELKKKYYDATHHCYAYRLNFGKDEKYRQNDDGEPTGTAAKPIYGQILSNDITNVLIVVVRYFGGTKLGVSRLTNAYKSASKQVIIENCIIEKIIYIECEIEYNIADINNVMRIIKLENLKVLRQEYIGNRIITSVEVRKSMLDVLEKKFLPFYEININKL